MFKTKSYMKRKDFLNVCLCLLAAVVGFSCVSSKKYNELLAKSDACAQKGASLEKENMQYSEDLTECKAKTAHLEDLLLAARMEADTMRRDYLLCNEELTQLKNSYSQMDKRYKSTVSSKNELAEALSLKEAELAEKEAELAEKEKALAEKEARVNELQGILNRKDAEMNALLDKVNDALLGFKDKGLSVYTKNGKVYVSMDEKLLFASGSWTVGADGREALRELSGILARNPEIQVMIEGHTDNVTMRGRGDVKDNWDLSVMRATAIAKILLENKEVNPAQVAASGRGEYLPIASIDDAEGRVKNRRTEIILTPKLDELFQLLGN